MVAAIVGLILVVGVLVVIGAAFFSPFGTTTVDRSGPALLEQMKDLEEFTAAEAEFIQELDIEEDARFLPDVLKGRRITALISGSVRATVDFGDLNEDSVTVSEDGSQIQVRLPQPQLADAEIDESGIKILDRDRGLFDRIGEFFSENPFDDSELYDSAEEKLDEAARESDLIETARENTELWLTTFLTAAGFDEIQISWENDPK